MDDDSDLCKDDTLICGAEKEQSNANLLTSSTDQASLVEAQTSNPPEVDHSSSSLVLTDTVVAFSFTRSPEVCGRAEDSAYFKVNQATGVGPLLYSQHPDAANMMNLQNIHLFGERLTESIDSCASRLETLLNKDVSAGSVARLITSMLNIPINESSTSSSVLVDIGPLPWSGKILAAAIKQQSPTLSWTEVLDCFDSIQYFSVRSVHALQFLTDIFTYEKQFPIEKLYTPWLTNKDAHFSWLVQITTHPTVFNVLDYPHTLANIQCLKIMPDESDRSLIIWRCLELVDVFFRLGENTNLSQTIYGQLSWGSGPITKCPDVFGLVMVQLTSPLTQFRLYILKKVIVQLIASHANAVPVLNYIWNNEINIESLRTLVLNSFSDFYTNSDDQNRLTRILEVAHELKPNGLGELFNLPQYKFAIDLACLAARRDFLKLDKFLDDKLNEIGEPFAKHLCQFLKWKVTSKTNALPFEIMQTVFSALQVRAPFMPVVAAELNHLLQQIRTPVPFANPFNHLPRPPSAQANWMLSSQGTSNIAASRLGEAGSPMDFRPMGRGDGLTNAISTLNLPSSMDLGFNKAFTADDDPSNAVFSDSTQEEANMYFMKIYDYQNPLSVEDFLWRMKHLSTSQVQSEKELLSCLLKNLFDEFKFFAEYPEKELRTTAEVYGGIIREGIVVNMKFATAIRRIVEALQAPRNSLLNTFGMVAINECRACLYKYTKICQMVSNLECFSWLNDELREYITCGAQGNLPAFHNAAINMDPPSMINNTHRNTPQFMQATPASRLASRSIGVSSMITTPSSEILMNATAREGCNISPPDEKIVDSIKFMINNLSQINLAKKAEEMKQLMKSQDEKFLSWLAQYFVINRVTIESNLQNLYNNFLISLGDDTLNQLILRETYRNINILLRSDKRQDASSFGNRQLLKNLGLWLGSITIARNEPILYEDLNLKGILLDAFFRGQHELLYVVPFVTKILLSTKQSIIFPPRSTWIYSILKVLAEIHNQPDLQLNLKFEIEVLCKELQIELRDIEVSSVLKDSSRLPSLYQPKNAPGRMDSASPAQNLGFPAAYRSHMDIDPQSQQRIIQGIQQHMASFNNAAGNSASSNTQSSFQPQNAGVHPSIHQQQIMQQAAIVAAQQKQLQQHHLQGQSQLPSFMQNLSHYNYGEINKNTTNEPAAQTETTTTSSNIVDIVNNPHIKLILQQAQKHSVKDLLEGITNRAINVSIPATECLCRKDFAMNPDEKQFRRATHQMMRAMTAAMAAITCREPLLQSIQAYLKQALAGHLGFNQTEVNKQLDDTIMQLAELSVDQAVHYIVKNASEKAISGIDAAMENDYAIRNQCRTEGRQFKADPQLTSLNSKLPDALKIIIGTVDEEAFRVYEEFTKSALNSDSITDEVADPMRRVNFAFGAERAALPANNFDLQNRMQTSHNLRVNADSTFQFGENNTQTYMHNPLDNSSRSTDDFQGKVESVLREWINLCHNQSVARDLQTSFAQVIAYMQKLGLLNTDDTISKFFKVCTDICFDVAYRLLRNEAGENTSHQSRKQRCFFTLEAFVKLSCLMVKHSDDQNHAVKLNLLKKILSILTQAVAIDHETHQGDFNGLPFLRIFISLFNGLTGEDPALDPIASEILECFSTTMVEIQPRRLPGFIYHWLEIIGNRSFLARFFQGHTDTKHARLQYIQLLIYHLRYFSPFLRGVQINNNVLMIYKGTLRIVLVILHDFPDVLSEFHYVLCDAIQPNCIQLRNLILCACPRDIAAQEINHSQNKEMMESLPIMNENPKLHHEMSNLLQQDIQVRLDNYLRHRTAVDFLAELPSILMTKPSLGCKYNITTMNAIVICVGVRAIDWIHEKGLRICINTVANTAYMDVFQNLSVSLCTQGRYLLFNAITNHLRYPNSHTNYFSNTLLYLFLQAHNNEVREQITRIFLERLIVKKPHPWGLVMTFNELTKNKDYKFWNYDFIHSSQEIENWLKQNNYF